MAERPPTSERVWLWWLRRMPGRDRLVLLCALVVRLAAIIMLGYVLPLVWARLPHPGLSLLLVAGLAAEGLIVVGWWVARRGLVRASLWIDLPAITLALVVGAALTEPQGAPGWTMFTYPYAVLISLTYGFTCRTLAGALGCGALCAAAGMVGLVVYQAEPLGTLAQVAPTYFVNPAVGWGCARLLRRASVELEAARSVAVRETAVLVTAEHRARLASALHDRVLQTLEALGRGGAIGDAGVRDRVAAQAAWLRRYIETGRLDQSGDLSVGLEAVARAAQQAGAVVDVNHARLGVIDPSGGLGAEQREALVEATHYTIAAFNPVGASIVVRAAPDVGGILVTVLSAGGAPPDAVDIADARSRLVLAGGRLILEETSYAELWVPAQPTPDPHERPER